MLTSVTIMIQLELPAVNVLSKVDLIEQYGELRTYSPSAIVGLTLELVSELLTIKCSLLAKNLEFFTGNGDLTHLIHILGKDPLLQKFANLNRSLVQIIEDFPFVGYQTLNIEDKESVLRLLRVIDKSNGYMYADIDAARLVYQKIIGHPEMDHRWTFEIQERYMGKDTRRKRG